MSGIKRLLSTMAASLSLIAAAPSVSANVLTFDDLVGTAFFSAPYMGFVFETSGTCTTPLTATAACGVGSWWHSDDDSTNGVWSTSPSTSLTTWGGGPDTVGLAEDSSLGIKSTFGAFKFGGASFRSPRDDAGFVFFDLYLDGALVYSDLVTGADVGGSTPLPVFYNPGYAGLVDEVRVFGYQQYFALDDFTYEVPEPATAALVLFGMIGLAATRRRRAR